MSHTLLTIGSPEGLQWYQIITTLGAAHWDYFHYKWPPKSDLLYNETAATMIMKYSSLETEEIATDAVEQGGSMCARIGFAL